MGGDGEAEDGLQGMLETMMSQLMSKEVLYEPLKEMHEKVCKSSNSALQIHSDHVDSSLAISLKTRVNCRSKIRTVTQNSRTLFPKSLRSLKRRTIRTKIQR